MLGANLMNMAAALRWATQAAAGATGSEVARSMVLGSMELHRVVYDLGLVFFGFACLVLGHLLRVSGLVPKLLGVGLMLAGVVYLLGSFSVVLAPEFAPIIDPLYVLTLVSELALAAWLSIKGIWSPSRAQRASAEFA